MAAKQIKINWPATKNCGLLCTDQDLPYNFALVSSHFGRRKFFINESTPIWLFIRRYLSLFFYGCGFRSGE